MEQLATKDEIQEATDMALKRVEELLQLGYYPAARMVLDQLLIVNPECLNGLLFYGLLCYKEKKYSDSIMHLKQAISLSPDNPDAYNNIGLSYMESGQPKEAEVNLKKAIDLRPDNAIFVKNLAMVQRASGNLEEAVTTYKKALEIDPKSYDAWECIGSIYGQKKEIDKAIECFHKAIAINSESLASRVDLAYAYHLLGEWEKGWENYEYRLKYWHKTGRNPGKFYEIYPPERAWNGVDSLKDKTVIVYCEQGTGDIIQFIRFVPWLTKAGAKVRIDVPDNLKELFKEFGPLKSEFPEETYDYHCSVMSLPYLFKIPREEYLGDKPYFHAEKIDMKQYQDKFKVGIVWAGNPGHPNDINRSCKLSNFLPFQDIPGIQLFSLQKEIHPRAYANDPDKLIDLTEGCKDLKIVDMSMLLTDFAATASVIQSMDLIITVDTSVLHLAGAIGKETWALIPYNPDWRWKIEGNKTIWYDSVSLFRQPSFGDWSSVFKNVFDELVKKCPNLN